MAEFKIECHISEEDLLNLKIMEDVEEDDEGVLQNMADCTDVFEDDIEIASIITGTKAFDICTTNSKYNLYLFENEQNNDGDWETVDAKNVTLDENLIKEGYQSLCQYLINLI